MSGITKFEDSTFQVACSGKIKTVDLDGSMLNSQPTDGIVSSLQYDSTGGLFVTDFHNRCINSKESGESTFQVLVGEYEGKRFAGPNCLCFDQDGTLFFTDSGPMGETSLSRPKGSVFCIKPEDQLLKPLALECLAYPSGIAASDDGNFIYVAETMANRILRFVRRPHGVYYSSVFHTFSGGFGPTALACDQHGRLFVARFEFAGVYSEGVPLNGIVSVLGADGSLLAEVVGPGPELAGMIVSVDVLLVTERSTSSLYSAQISEILMT